MTTGHSDKGLAAELLAAGIQGEFLASVDLAHKEDIDREFLAVLRETRDPSLADLDGQVRRVLVPWCHLFWQRALAATREDDIREDTLAVLAIQRAFLIGYEMGRRLRRPVTIQARATNKGG